MATTLNLPELLFLRTDVETSRGAAENYGLERALISPTIQLVSFRHWRRLNINGCESRNGLFDSLLASLGLSMGVLRMIDGRSTN